MVRVNRDEVLAAIDTMQMSAYTAYIAQKLKAPAKLVRMMLLHLDREGVVEKIGPPKGIYGFKWKRKDPF